MDERYPDDTVESDQPTIQVVATWPAWSGDDGRDGIDRVLLSAADLPSSLVEQLATLATAERLQAHG